MSVIPRRYFVPIYLGHGVGIDNLKPGVVDLATVTRGVIQFFQGATDAESTLGVYIGNGIFKMLDGMKSEGYTIEDTINLINEIEGQTYKFRNIKAGTGITIDLKENGKIAEISLDGFSEKEFTALKALLAKDGYEEFKGNVETVLDGFIEAGTGGANLTVAGALADKVDKEEDKSLIEKELIRKLDTIEIVSIEDNSLAGKYQLRYKKQDGTYVNWGTFIEIPKDNYIADFSIKQWEQGDTIPSGSIVGDYYFQYILEDGTVEKIPANALMDVYTSGSAIDDNIKIIIGGESGREIIAELNGVPLAKLGKINFDSIQASETQLSAGLEYSIVSTLETFAKNIKQLFLEANKANTAIQGVKVAGVELTKDGEKKVDIPLYSDSKPGVVPKTLGVPNKAVLMKEGWGTPDMDVVEHGAYIGMEEAGGDEPYYIGKMENCIQVGNNIKVQMKTLYAEDIDGSIPDVVMVRYNGSLLIEDVDFERQSNRYDIIIKDRILDVDIDNIEVRMKTSVGGYGEVFKDAVDSAIQTTQEAKEFLENNIRWYGVEWDVTVNSPTVTRIGNLDYHRSEPIQALMRGALIAPDGKLVRWLPEDSWVGVEGLDGTDGNQVMGWVPGCYFKSEREGNIQRMKFSLVPLTGFNYIKGYWRGCYKGTFDRTTDQFCSVKNDTPQFRGGSYISSRANLMASWDGTGRSVLGTPASDFSRGTARTASRKDRTDDWGLEAYHEYCYWWALLILTFGTRNLQATYQPERNSQGFRHGGLGAGVTNLDAISYFKSYYGPTPIGFTDILGNNSGVRKYTMPFGYNSSPVDQEDKYEGVFSSSKTYEEGDYISDKEDEFNGSGDGKLYRVLKKITAGTFATIEDAIAGSDYLESITRTSTYQTRFKCWESVFGDLYENIDQVIVRAFPTYNEFWICRNHIKAGDTFNKIDYEYAGTQPMLSSDNSHWLGDVAITNDCIFISSDSVGSSSDKWCDRVYYSPGSESGSLRSLFVGGHSYNGPNAGPGFSDSRHGVSDSYSARGGRLCLKKTEHGGN